MMTSQDERTQGLRVAVKKICAKRMESGWYSAILYLQKCSGHQTEDNRVVVKAHVRGLDKVSNGIGQWWAPDTSQDQEVNKGKHQRIQV